MDLASARCTDRTNLQAVSSGCLCVWPLSVQAQGAKYRMLDISSSGYISLGTTVFLVVFS